MPSTGYREERVQRSLRYRFCMAFLVARYPALAVSADCLGISLRSFNQSEVRAALGVMEFPHPREACAKVSEGLATASGPDAAAQSVSCWTRRYPRSALKSNEVHRDPGVNPCFLDVFLPSPHVRLGATRQSAARFGICGGLAQLD